jgi:hypothetical protein
MKATTEMVLTDNLKTLNLSASSPTSALRLLSSRALSSGWAGRIYH